MEIAIAIGLGAWFALMGGISYLCLKKSSNDEEEDK